jgi:hypothetical protein
MNDRIMQKLKHTGGEWRVRKTVDESGDYPFPTYDILAVHEWGPMGIACADQNPYNARLMATAPELLIELLKCVAELDKTGFASVQAETVIMKATGWKYPELNDILTELANEGSIDEVLETAKQDAERNP